MLSSVGLIGRITCSNWLFTSGPQGRGLPSNTFQWKRVFHCLAVVHFALYVELKFEVVKDSAIKIISRGTCKLVVNHPACHQKFHTGIPTTEAGQQALAQRHSWHVLQTAEHRWISLSCQTVDYFAQATISCILYYCKAFTSFWKIFP